jgi:hypothetical protein
MQNHFHHIFNNRLWMALLVFAIAGLVSFSYVSSVFAPCPSGCWPWQKMQTNSISTANQTASLASTANNTATSLTNSSQLSNQ